MSVPGVQKSTSYLTISVDDGHPTDFRAAELLSKFGLKATFYIPQCNPEREVLGPREVRELGKGFEVGGHTLHHLPLTSLNLKDAEAEVVEGKAWLEDVLGSSVHSFCYPRGKFNRKIESLVKKAGFLGARTCMQNMTSVPHNAFRCGVSTQAYSHSRQTQIRHALLEANFEGLISYFRVQRLAVDWREHFSRTLDHVSCNGGVAHLYFHSWEIEEQGQWGKLTAVLQDLSTRREFVGVTNGELFNLSADCTT